jgi:dipeptide/tripeptide permease
MELHGLPNDILPNIDPITIILLIPVMDRLIYPFIRTKLHFAFTSITRISLGFMFAACAMLYAGVLQAKIYAVEPEKIHIAWQAPAYMLVAISEILASITGLELAYAKAPENMKSFIMSLFLLTSAGGSALGILIAPFAKDPWLHWMYLGLSIAAAGTGFAFWRLFHNGGNELEKAIEHADNLELAERHDLRHGGNEEEV